jgi:hypothetical protein
MAAIQHQIPRKTLERRLKKNNDKKGPMGPSSMFGKENEDKLVAHIKAMQAKGFPLTITDVRRIAYDFAEHLQLKHRFNTETQKAGYDWLQMFLSRHKDITLRKSEGVSLARASAMNKTEVNAYFQLLESVLIQDNEMLAPNCVFNMDESGLQLNSRPGHVLAQKGSKAVSTVTSTEKGETITIIACCNAEGTFLPPACIMKGKNKKPEFEDGMPPGTRLFMSQKSAYITSEIFLEWLKTHFVPRKPAGKVVLLLDGHSTHCNSVEMLEYANENDIILISMPSHTSHYLQPLDRSVFKSLKTHFYEQCRLWLIQNPGRRITRLSFGALLNKAWGKAASAENAISGFRATGAYPLNPAAVPDYAFIEEPAGAAAPVSNDATVARAIPPTPSAVEEDSDEDAFIPGCSNVPRRDMSYRPEIAPRTSETLVNNTIESNVSKPGTPEERPLNNDPDYTPSRILQDISPIPQRLAEICKRAKQVGTLLTSEAHISARKCAEEKKIKKENKKMPGKSIKKEGQAKKNTVRVNKRKAIRRLSDSSGDVPLAIISKNKKKKNLKGKDNCRGCGENYYETILVEDWLQCTICMFWVHENCTEFDDACSKCGQEKKKRLRTKK